MSGRTIAFILTGFFSSSVTWPSNSVAVPSRSAASFVIVALGDSTTAGTPKHKSPLESPPNGSGDEKSDYTYWIRRAHPDWEILNRGVNGERSDQIAARFKRDVAELTPAAVVILAGVNDVYQGRAIEDVTERLERMYDDAAHLGIKVVAATIVPYNTATPEQNAKMHAINQWIADYAARDPNVELADTRKAAASPANRDKLAGSPDGLHPDVIGYRRMGEAVEAVLVKLLK